MPDSPDRTGSIFPDYWIRCGACGLEHPLGTNARAMTQIAARQQGWEKTRWDGWVCPECAARAAEQGDDNDR